MIAALIETENKHAPLSDQELAVRLQESGISISRRAVAKYRNEMFIPCSYSRNYET